MGIPEKYALILLDKILAAIAALESRFDTNARGTKQKSMQLRIYNGLNWFSVELLIYVVLIVIVLYAHRLNIRNALRLQETQHDHV